MTKVIYIPMPDYKKSHSADYDKVGGAVHEHIKRHFAGKKVVVRALDSSEHEGSVDQLVEKIVEHGTDRHDPSVEGRDYDKHPEIDIFGIRYDVDASPGTIPKLVKKFHEAYNDKLKKPVRVDIYMVYDAEHLEQVPATKEGARKVDQFKFKDPSKKKEALKAVIRLTS
jgi:nicotinic acid phosphoribosyltransferase